MTPPERHLEQPTLEDLVHRHLDFVWRRGMNQATFAVLEPELERIESEICAPLAEQCQPELGSCSPSTTTCRNGHCAQRP
jgi:hypothetical protein